MAKQNKAAETPETNLTPAEQAEQIVRNEIMECLQEAQIKAEMDENGVMQVESDGCLYFIEVGREDEALPLFVMVSTLLMMNAEAGELSLLRVANEMNHTFAAGKMRVYDVTPEDSGEASVWHGALSVAETEQTIEDFAAFFQSAFDAIRIMLYTLTQSHPEVIGITGDEEEAE